MTTMPAWQPSTIKVGEQSFLLIDPLVGKLAAAFGGQLQWTGRHLQGSFAFGGFGW
jgi:hypothetical protein